MISAQQETKPGTTVTRRSAVALGEYSVVRYGHRLRGDRINLGVLVWHPLLGKAFRFSKNLQRARCIDEGADTVHLRAEIDRVIEVFSAWKRTEPGPLESLAAEFRYGLSVSSPQGIRVADPVFAVERLFASLVAPEPFVRASSTSQFVKSLGTRISDVLTQDFKIADVETNFLEAHTFQPVRIAASWGWGEARQVWRGVSFASSATGEPQLTLAKAFHAENQDLVSLPLYAKARLAVAVQLTQARRASRLHARARLDQTRHSPRH